MRERALAKRGQVDDRLDVESVAGETLAGVGEHDSSHGPAKLGAQRMKSAES